MRRKKASDFFLVGESYRLPRLYTSANVHNISFFIPCLLEKVSVASVLWKSVTSYFTRYSNIIIKVLAGNIFSASVLYL